MHTPLHSPPTSISRRTWTNYCIKCKTTASSTQTLPPSRPITSGVPPRATHGYNPPLHNTPSFEERFASHALLAKSRWLRDLRARLLQLNLGATSTQLDFEHRVLSLLLALARNPLHTPYHPPPTKQPLGRLALSPGSVLQLEELAYLPYVLYGMRHDCSCRCSPRSVEQAYDFFINTPAVKEPLPEPDRLSVSDWGEDAWGSSERSLSEWESESCSDVSSPPPCGPTPGKLGARKWPGLRFEDAATQHLGARGRHCRWRFVSVFCIVRLCVALCFCVWPCMYVRGYARLCVAVFILASIFHCTCHYHSQTLAPQHAVVCSCPYQRPLRRQGPSAGARPRRPPRAPCLASCAVSAVTPEPSPTQQGVWQSTFLHGRCVCNGGEVLGGAPVCLLAGPPGY